MLHLAAERQVPHDTDLIAREAALELALLDRSDRPSAAGR